MAHMWWKAWYGPERLDMPFPDGWDVRVYPMPEAPRLTDEALADAVRAPVGTPPLRELAAGRRSAVIASDDISRPADAARIIPVLADELNAAGIPDERILVIVALGGHRQMHRLDLLRKFGQALLTLIFVLTVNFFLFRVLPSDPVANMVRAQKLTRVEQQNLIEEWGLDKPLELQFIIYITHPWQLGLSQQSSRPVVNVVGERGGEAFFIQADAAGYAPCHDRLEAHRRQVRMHPQRDHPARELEREAQPLRLRARQRAAGRDALGAENLECGGWTPLYFLAVSAFSRSRQDDDLREFKKPRKARVQENRLRAEGPPESSSVHRQLCWLPGEAGSQPRRDPACVGGDNGPVRSAPWLRR